MKYIDTHCHLNFAVYNDDRDEVINRMNQFEVAGVIVGTQATTSKSAVTIAQANHNLWAIIGLHPIHTVASYHDHDELGDEGSEFTSRGEIFDLNYYQSLLQSSNKVVGVGECGLDYYRVTHDEKEVQEKAFRAQIEFAIEHDLPLMLHVRPSQGSYDAYYDVLEILRVYKILHQNLRGQLHFFAGTSELINNFIELGFYISFTGVVTFASMYRELVQAVPLHRILSETDAPYVSPVPFRGTRNEPIHVREIVATIAEIHSIEVETLALQIQENVKNLYGIVM